MLVDAPLLFTKTPRVIWWEESSKARRCLLLLISALLFELIGFTLVRNTLAETTSPPRPISPEHVPGFPKRGSVTTMANLRSAPSMQSEIVSIIQDAMPVEILTETGRWYRVKTEAGLEAWIGKSLVIIEPRPRKMPSPVVSGSAVPPEMQALDGSPSAAPVMADASAETTTLQSKDTRDEQDVGASLGLSEAAPPISLNEAVFKWSSGGLLPSVQRLEVYVIPVMLIVLILATSFQLKAARQLQRAMREMGLILDIVDGIYAHGMLAQTGDGTTTAKVLSKNISTPQLETPPIQFSALEHATIQAMSDYREVEERDLAEALAVKGFTGALIKAVIGGIIRKTEASGQQCIDVRYVQGRYRYQLRREGVSALRKS